MTAIQLLTFDLDDTLWDARPVLINAEKAMMAWLQTHRPELLRAFNAEALREFRMQVAQQRPELAHRVSALRREALFQALQAAGYGEVDAHSGADAAFDSFYQARQAVQFFEDVVRVLEELRQDYRLAAITNGNADPERLGLDRHFEFVLSADAFNTRKPDPELFEEALARTGVAADAAVHIGDHPLDDMEGARRVGFQTVWANLARREWTQSWRPDGEFHQWRDLPALLRTLQRPG